MAPQGPIVLIFKFNSHKGPAGPFLVRLGLWPSYKGIGPCGPIILVIN